MVNLNLLFPICLSFILILIQEKPKDIILIRHGQYYHLSQHQTALTAVGEQQALMTGQYLQSFHDTIGIGSVYTSDLQRAMATTIIIQQQLPHGMTVLICPLLREGSIPPSCKHVCKHFYLQTQAINHLP